MFGHTPSNTPLIDQVITEALKTFVPGMTNTNKLLLKKIQLRPGSRSYPDDNFICDANSIPNSNLVASCGPQFEDMANFFKDTALNAKRPISKVVVICDPHFVSASETVFDFLPDCYDYFLTEREVKLDNEISFQIKHVDNSISSEEKEGLTNIGTLSADLTVKHLNESKPLNVIFFAVKDGLTIQLDNDYQKQTMWDLLNYSKDNSLLVHCRQGIGRTGSFILTLELLKHCDHVFASNDPTAIATEIHTTLNRMRKVRPGFIIAPEQFATSIRHAHEVRMFALKQGYIKDNSQDNKRSREETQTIQTSRKQK